MVKPQAKGQNNGSRTLICGIVHLFSSIPFRDTVSFIEIKVFKKDWEKKSDKWKVTNKEWQIKSDKEWLTYTDWPKKT